MSPNAASLEDANVKSDDDIEGSKGAGIVSFLSSSAGMASSSEESKEIPDAKEVATHCKSIRDLFTKPQEMLGLNSNTQLQNNLRSNIQFLFSYLERVAATSGFTEEGLSGLSELYMGELDNLSSGNGNSNIVDSETLWGQLELQNQTLISLLNKTVKELGKSAKRYEKEGDKYHLVRLVDLNDNSMSGEDDENEISSAHDGDSEKNESEASDDEEKGEKDEEEDEVARRIRERMERSMADMEDSSDDENSDNVKDAEKRESRRKISASEQDAPEGGSSDSSAIDPAAEDLNDGFFDLHDMEDFADEEEDYHMPPDDGDQQNDGEDSGGEDKIFSKKSKTQNKRHRRAAYDESDDDSEDDEEEDKDDELKVQVLKFRRKKYRADDEIDALMGLYESSTSGAFGEDIGDDAVDPANMTAADFFGKPNPKYVRDRKKAAENDQGPSHSVQENVRRAKKRTQSSVNDTFDADSVEDAEEEILAEWNDNDEESGDDDNEGEEPKDKEGFRQTSGRKRQMLESSMEKQSKKLMRQTKELEEELLAEKPWAMRGETAGTTRPVNSLLDATPQFTVTGKMAPVVTEEQMESVEEIIKRRILDEDWDDVVPRDLPNINKKGSVLNEAPEVSQERSKLGLGELYEREYLKKVKGYDVDAVEARSKEQKLEDEIKSMYANLCASLDALSNYNFAPRPLEEDADIHNVTTPAIAMEEVLPLHVSDARTTAPEEVYGAKKGREGVLKGEKEIDQKERKQMRAAKKAARRKERRAKEVDERLVSRLTPGLGLNNPYEKRKLREDLSRSRARGKVVDGAKDLHSDYTVSTTFFQRLQEDVKKSVHGEGEAQSSKRGQMVDFNSSKHKSSSYKL